MRARTVSVSFAVLAGVYLADEAAAQPRVPAVPDDHPPEDMRMSATKEHWDEVYRECVGMDHRVPGTARLESDPEQPLTIEFRCRGSSTRVLPKKSFNIRFRDDPGDLLYGSDRMNANAMYTDASMMHERLAWGMFETLEQPASRTRYVNLHFNEQESPVNDIYEGLFLHIERVDEDLLANHGLDPDGTLVRDRFIRNASLPDSAFGLDRSAVDDVDELANLLEANFDERNDPDWRALAELVKWVVETPAGSEFASGFRNRFHVDNFIDWLAIHTLIADVDSYADDFWLYRDSDNDDPWQIIPWDFDRAFGWYVGMESHTFSYEHDLRMGLRRRANDNLLIIKFLETPALRSQFDARLRELMDDALSVEHLNSRIDTIADTIGAHVELRPGPSAFVRNPRNHHGEIGRHRDSVERVKDFVALRYAFLDRMLDPVTGAAYEASATISPADAGSSVLLTDANGWTVASLDVDGVNGTGRVVARVAPDDRPNGVDRLWTIEAHGADVRGRLNLYYRNSFRRGAPVRRNWYRSDMTVGDQWNLAVARLEGSDANVLESSANAYSNKVSTTPNVRLRPGSRQFFAVVDRGNPGDFTLRAKPAVARGRTWYLRSSASAGPADLTFSYGRPADHKLLCDWNGDGRRTPTVVRGRDWYIRNTFSGGQADGSFRYGRPGDMPVCGNWNGRGGDGPGVVRGRTWHLKHQPGGGAADRSFSYGVPTDRPVVGDWTGDGRDTPGVVRDARWFLRHVAAGGAADQVFRYGVVGDTPIVGDWNGSGQDGVGVVRGRVWHLRHTPSRGRANLTFGYGVRTDEPLVWR